MAHDSSADDIQSRRSAAEKEKEAATMQVEGLVKQLRQAVDELENDGWRTAQITGARNGGYIMPGEALDLRCISKWPCADVVSDALTRYHNATITLKGLPPS
jgi:hypothetical protein